MTEYTTQNGKKLNIVPATLRDALNLKNTIEKAIIEKNIDIANVEIDLKALREKKFNMKMITSLMSVIMAVDSDDNFIISLFKCLERCLYDNQKIVLETFEDIDARADYYEVILWCIKENLLPFIKTLFSMSEDLEKKSPKDSQKQKTKQA